jgi:hypothetical protein
MCNECVSVWTEYMTHTHTHTHTHMKKQEQESMATEFLVSVVRKCIFQGSITVNLWELIYDNMKTV